MAKLLQHCSGKYSLFEYLPHPLILEVKEKRDVVSTAMQMGSSGAFTIVWRMRSEYLVPCNAERDPFASLARMFGKPIHSCATDCSELHRRRKNQIETKHYYYHHQALNHHILSRSNIS